MSTLVTICDVTVTGDSLSKPFLQSQPHAKQATPVWWRYSHLKAGAWHTSAQGRNEVRQRPGQEASLVPPCSNLRSLGSSVLDWRKYMWHYLDFLAPHSHSALPVVIQRPHSDSAPGELCPPRYDPATV